LWARTFGKRIPALAAAFAVLLLIGVAMWLYIRERQSNALLRQLLVERIQMQEREKELEAKLKNEEREHSELLQQLQNPPPTPKPSQETQTPNIATFLLPLISVRGGEATSFTVKPEVQTVQLEAVLGNANYSSYQADLESADGAAVYRSKSNLRKTGNRTYLLLKIPASRLKTNDYVLKVSGVGLKGQLEDAGFYSFRIVKN